MRALKSYQKLAKIYQLHKIDLEIFDDQNNSKSELKIENTFKDIYLDGFGRTEIPGDSYEFIEQIHVPKLGLRAHGFLTFKLKGES